MDHSSKIMNIFKRIISLFKKPIKPRGDGKWHHPEITISVTSKTYSSDRPLGVCCPAITPEGDQVMGFYEVDKDGTVYLRGYVQANEKGELYK